MIARALNLQIHTKVSTKFADEVEIPQWEKGAVKAIRKLGIVSGRGGNQFVPNDMATKAFILLRMLEFDVMILDLALHSSQQDGLDIICLSSAIITVFGRQPLGLARYRLLRRTCRLGGLNGLSMSSV